MRSRSACAGIRICTDVRVETARETTPRAETSYPFILLNLAFSTQAAYAAPPILLAQTRQVDRDKAASDQLEAHREEVATRMQLGFHMCAAQTSAITKTLQYRNAPSLRSDARASNTPDEEEGVRT